MQKHIKWLTLLLTLIFSTCQVQKNSMYHCDWIIDHFEINGGDSINMIVVYNLKLDLTRGVAQLPGVYVNNNYLDRETTFKIRSSSKGDSIFFEHHSFFSGGFKIQCQDNACCELVIENDSLLMQFIYNGDIPYGRSRDCE